MGSKKAGEWGGGAVAVREREKRLNAAGERKESYGEVPAGFKKGGYALS